MAHRMIVSLYRPRTFQSEQHAGVTKISSVQYLSALMLGFGSASCLVSQLVRLLVRLRVIL
jgi:hypothetical protein